MTFAGFARPLDAINQAVGAIVGNDAAKDVRLADGAVAMGTQKVTRYIDNIIEGVSAGIDKVIGENATTEATKSIIDKYITGKKLTSASRPGDIFPSDNFLAKIAGIKIVPCNNRNRRTFYFSKFSNL